jgi:hypothetical protein
MTDRPIIFSAQMIRALLDGRKTQTRRVLKPQPVGCLAWVDPPSGFYPSNKIWSRLPYDPGDRLWVREAWHTARSLDAKSGKAIEAACLDAGYRHAWAPLQYEADGARNNWFRDDWPECTEAGRYRHAPFMPRWASRLTLIVTDVRVQRLQDISEADARAEGLTWSDGNPGPMGPTRMVVEARDEFRHLWNSLHGPEAWAANPWVVALTFTVNNHNIDKMPGSTK